MNISIKIDPYSSKMYSQLPTHFGGTIRLLALLKYCGIARFPCDIMAFFLN